MMSNEELFAKADFEAKKIEEQWGKPLSPNQYLEFIHWYSSNIEKPVELRTQNPLEYVKIEERATDI